MIIPALFFSSLFAGFSQFSRFSQRVFTFAWLKSFQKNKNQLGKIQNQIDKKNVYGQKSGK